MKEFENEKELEDTVEKWFIAHNWTVHRQVKRNDCVTWEHPYTADLIIEHPFYSQKIGAIGLELKINDQCKTIAEALKQVVTKYQGHYFEGIEKPVFCWGIILDKPAYVDFLRTTTSFGIGLLDWKEITHPNYYGGPDSKYQRLKIAECDELSIHINPEGFTATNVNHLQGWLQKKTKWLKGQNLQNIGTLNPPLSIKRGVFDYV